MILFHYNKHILQQILYQRRFETAPRRGAIVQTVAGNLVEVSSAERIEIFNGVNRRPNLLENLLHDLHIYENSRE
jgi:hypothetical protein